MSYGRHTYAGKYRRAQAKLDGRIEGKKAMHHYAYDARSTTANCLYEGIWSKAELRYSGLNTASSPFPHRALTVEKVGDGRDGYAGGLGDINNGGPAFGNRHHGFRSNRLANCIVRLGVAHTRIA